MDPRRQSQVENTAVREVKAVADSHGLLSRILVVLLVVLSLAGIVFLGAKALSAVTADSSIKVKQFQAVFLTNGQVYFGNLTKVDGSYVKLTDIFYLQVSSSGSQATAQPASSTAQQQVSLAKLGGELHGPEDSMYISRSQVLFYENLKTDGKVAQAIKNYQDSNKK